MKPDELRARLIERYQTLWQAAQAFDHQRSGGWLLSQLRDGLPDPALRRWLEHQFHITL